MCVKIHAIALSHFGRAWGVSAVHAAVMLKWLSHSTARFNSIIKLRSFFTSCFKSSKRQAWEAQESFPTKEPCIAVLDLP